MAGRKESPGQALWLKLYRAEFYDREASKLASPPQAVDRKAARSTRRWLEGMSRHLKTTFPVGLRDQREALGLTQLELSRIADMTVTGLAMIERRERSPTLDTAARICWALDVAAGVTADEI